MTPESDTLGEKEVVTGAEIGSHLVCYYSSSSWSFLSSKVIKIGLTGSQFTLWCPL